MVCESLPNHTRSGHHIMDMTRKTSPQRKLLKFMDGWASGGPKNNETVGGFALCWGSTGEKHRRRSEPLEAVTQHCMCGEP